jgi:hypothetical protein
MNIFQLRKSKVKKKSMYYQLTQRMTKLHPHLTKSLSRVSHLSRLCMKIWMIPKDHYHLRKSKLEKNILKRKKRLGKDNMSSQDMISPVFGKRLVPANTHFTSLRKLRKHKFTSDKINHEICKHILN